MTNPPPNNEQLFSGSFAVHKGRAHIFCDCSAFPEANPKQALQHLINESAKMQEVPVFGVINNRYVVVDSTISPEKAKEFYNSNHPSLADAADAFTRAKFHQIGVTEQGVVNLMREQAGMRRLQTQPPTPHEVRINKNEPHDKPPATISGRG